MFAKKSTAYNFEAEPFIVDWDGTDVHAFVCSLKLSCPIYLGHLILLTCYVSGSKPVNKAASFCAVSLLLPLRDPTM